MYVIGGEFIENIETTEIAYFSIDEIPDNLAEEKTNKENAVVLLSGKKIFIHPNCVNTIREIGFYRWMKDPSTDKPIEKLQDGNDHTLDALLYACREWLKNQKTNKRRVGGFNIR